MYYTTALIHLSYKQHMLSLKIISKIKITHENLLCIRLASTKRFSVKTQFNWQFFYLDINLCLLVWMKRLTRKPIIFSDWKQSFRKVSSINYAKLTTFSIFHLQLSFKLIQIFSHSFSLSIIEFCDLWKAPAEWVLGNNQILLMTKI